MNKYKKKDCYNYMLPFTDGASDCGEDAKNVRTTGEPKHYIQLKKLRDENSCGRDHMFARKFVRWLTADAAAPYSQIGIYLRTIYGWRDDKVYRQRYSR
jgi:hypothetical protein